MVARQGLANLGLKPDLVQEGGSIGLPSEPLGGFQIRVVRPAG